MTKALAWPVIALVAILCLRRPLLSLVPLLPKFKYGDVEAQFGEMLSEAETIRARAGGETKNGVLDQPAFSRSGKGTRAETNRAARAAFDVPLNLVALSPRSAVLESWRYVDLALRRAVAKLGKPEGTPTSPHEAVKQLHRTA
jgi:hypothetical protein